MVGFYHGLSILNVDPTAESDISNGVVLSPLNGRSLIQIGVNYLVSTVQDREFVEAIYDVSNHHSTQ